jgi:hypothetical protein
MKTAVQSKAPVSIFKKIEIPGAAQQHIAHAKVEICLQPHKYEMTR